MAVEEIVLEGHIISNQTLNRVLDTITEMNGDFKMMEFQIGKQPRNTSRAVIEITAPNDEILNDILRMITRQGARRRVTREIQFTPVEIPGTFPLDFYSTTNLDTEIFYQGEWIKVEEIEMDCGIKLIPEEKRALCIPISETKTGDLIVSGSGGIRVHPLKPSDQQLIFSFMTSSVSSEKPKHLLLNRIARQMYTIRHEQSPPGKILFVCGPALVHTGAGKHFCRLINMGYVQTILAGNALAVHDIELAIFGTSLGISLKNGVPMEGGYRNHLRAINLVRRAGSIKQAIEENIVKEGIMFETVKHNVDVVLAGSIRDDGPLPEVITDSVASQQAMRVRCRDAAMVVMVATALHSIATGNLLPARIPTICVDINHAVVTKLIDRGSAQTLGIVTDVEPFIHELVDELEKIENSIS